MAAARVTISVEYLSLEHGLWCLHCNLSTGVRVWVVTTIAGETTLRSSSCCVKCGGRQVTG